MAKLTSQFNFTTEEETQTFHHQWVSNDAVHECITCFSRVSRDEPCSQLWLSKDNKGAKLYLSKQQQAVLDIIDGRNISTFILCDESMNNSAEHFLRETMARSIPQMLRWMFQKSLKLNFSIGCYVNVCDRVLIFETGNLNINHYYDVDQSVRIMFQMLLSRMNNYLSQSLSVTIAECHVKRIKLNVKRTRCSTDDSAVEELCLPMEYASLFERQPMCTKQALNKTENEISTVRDAYVKHLTESKGYFPPTIRVNLYCLQQCIQTKEIYVVPYHISEPRKPNKSNKSFLIMDDIMGNFKNLFEIKHPLPSRVEKKHPKTLHCDRCKKIFQDRTHFTIHRQLKCGEEFTIDTMHPEILEYYINCLPITRNRDNHAWYGITSRKTIMKKGLFVPIECDWRTEGSVNVLKGPCIVISSFDSPQSSPKRSSI